MTALGLAKKHIKKNVFQNPGQEGMSGTGQILSFLHHPFQGSLL